MKLESSPQQSTRLITDRGAKSSRRPRIFNPIKPLPEAEVGAILAKYCRCSYEDLYGPVVFLSHFEERAPGLTLHSARGRRTGGISQESRADSVGRAHK
jgi:hypothetical protein